MGRGRKPSRGGSRRFTDIETLKQQSREMNRRGAQRNVDEEDDEDDEEEMHQRVINRQGAVGELPPSESESEEDSDEDSPSKSKAAAASSNSLQQKNKKLNNLTLESLEITEEKKPTLNRKEREELARQEAKRKYQALTAAGKTDEAKADLARLAIIRAQREEAAKKRELEQKAKEAAAKAKMDARKKAQSNKI